jgi:hypothetical protein
MTNNTFLNRFLLILSFSAIALSCDDDEGGASGLDIDFGTIASSYNEADGDGTLFIPLRNATSSNLDKVSVDFGGNATEGEDFSLGSVTAEGITLQILDDSKYEDIETIRVMLVADEGIAGNAIHNVTILSNNCSDSEDITPDYFTYGFDASEIYAPDDIYGPYEIEWEQDETDPNKYWTHNFWDSGLNAYIIFDPATNTVSFPQQTPQANFPTRIVTSTPATITNPCTFTITVSYRGYTWDYEFVRHSRI